MNKYHYRNLMHNFDLKSWIQLYIYFHNSQLAEEPCDLLLQSYLNNSTQFQFQQVHQIAALLLNSTREKQYLRKHSRIVHHSVMNNDYNISEQFLINCQKLAISSIMQQDNLIEILDQVRGQLSGQHVKRIYFEENIRL